MSSLSCNSRFCRLSKKLKEKERKAAEEEQEEDDVSNPSKQAARMSFEKLWCEGWESPCVDTTVSHNVTSMSCVTLLVTTNKYPVIFK